MVLFEIWSLGHRPFDACPIEKDVSSTYRCKHMGLIVISDVVIW